MKKKLFGMLFVLAFMFGITDTIMARSWTTGVQFINIPGGGSTKTNYNKPNAKTSSDSSASIYCTRRTAALSNDARLVNSEGAGRSSWIGINEFKLVHPGTTAVNGYYTYASVRSNSIEWGNNNDVVLDFSADYISK